MRPFAACLVVLAIGGCVADSPKTENTHRIDVVVRIGDDGPEIVDLSVAPHAGDPLPPSVPTPGTDDGRHFLTLQGPDGKTLHRVPVATGVAPLSFAHRADESIPNALAGGQIRYDSDTRVVSIPLIAGATHLGINGNNHLKLHHGEDEVCPPCVLEPVLLHPEQLRDDGTVLDIVILGDGFQEHENDFFAVRARELSEALLDTGPFKRNADKIQIHMLPTVSKDSGVDDPLSATLKDTCLDLTGGTAGCCGTDQPDKIWTALGCRFPIRQVDLRVVIANVPVYGGRGHADVRAAYVNAYSRPEDEEPGDDKAAASRKKKFIGVGIHEIGHALAGLADEYAGCSPLTEQRWFANTATREQIENGTVPWLDLAHPDELTDATHFRYVYEIPESAVDVCPVGRPAVPEEYDGKLGLFWGAMYVDGEDSPCYETREDKQAEACNEWGDPRGANYFRPMANCKMRWIYHDFCRACDRELERAILRYVPTRHGDAQL